MIAVSSLVRTLVAWQHQTPRYFPDEYIYAALGRSLAHGHYEIRGKVAHFPAILEPLLAAPLWRLFSTQTAYELIQAQNVIAASLVAIPLYALARWLGLARPYSYLCALYGLVIPAFALVSLNTADLVAYPLVIAAIAMAVRALDAPTGKRQVAFLILATLATLARTQYFILVPAYIAGAVLLERRKVLRRHKIATLALIPVALAIAVAVLGFYSGVRTTTHLNGSFIGWFALQGFLLAVETGVAIVPGALIAIIRPDRRRETAFALFVGAFTVLLFSESAVYASNSGTFKERYLFTALPLVPIAYGLYLKRGRPYRLGVIALVAAIAAASARLPISAYAISKFRTDSQFLYGVNWLELRIGYASGALVVALLATAGGALAVWTAYRGDRWVAVVAAMSVAVAATFGTTKLDLGYTRNARALLPTPIGWIDAATNAPVTAIVTPYSARVYMFFALYWNQSIARELALDYAVPSDNFETNQLIVGANGRLLNSVGDLLIDRTATSATFWNASVLARATNLILWHPDGVPHLRTLIVGRYPDNWINQSGRVRAWAKNPDARGRGAAIGFTLSVPTNWSTRVRLKLAKRSFVLKPGMRMSVECWNASEPLNVYYSSNDVRYLGSNRPLTLKMTSLHTEAVKRPGTGCLASGR